MAKRSIFPKELEYMAVKLIEELKKEGKTFMSGEEFAKIFFEKIPQLKTQKEVLRQLMMHLAVEGHIKVEDGNVILRGGENGLRPPVEGVQDRRKGDTLRETPTEKKETGKENN
ncbi:protein of unknown function (plasmid) [Thermococcus nautili]|uniref:hypothetical protein n=1 Tax=Thermococcus nautili TaxID=195522 RepID=UPI002553ED55|nr:hypothetical protein [Thermococcus nautili]CAI1494250.1 protein of unknown function [Thermococcus nautili]